MITFSNIKAALPGGFTVDWEQDFATNIHDETYTTTGPDWTIGIPEEAEDALALAREYNEVVAKSLSNAIYREKLAAKSMDIGDLAGIINEINQAAKEEIALGGYESYSKVLDLLDELPLYYVDHDFHTPAKNLKNPIVSRYTFGEDINGDQFIVEQVQDTNHGFCYYQAYELPDALDGDELDETWSKELRLGAPLGLCIITED